MAKKLRPEFIEPADLSEDTIQHWIDIGRRQAQLTNELESAIEQGDVTRMFEVGRKICGLEKEADGTAV